MYAVQVWSKGELLFDDNAYGMEDLSDTLKILAPMYGDLNGFTIIVDNSEPLI